MGKIREIIEKIRHIFPKEDWLIIKPPRFAVEPRKWKARKTPIIRTDNPFVWLSDLFGIEKSLITLQKILRSRPILNHALDALTNSFQFPKWDEIFGGIHRSIGVAGERNW